MNLSGIFNIIILLGALQGLIISILLLCSKRNKLANRLLGTLIFLIALASFNLYGNYMDWFNIGLLRFLTEVVPMVIVMPMGPLIYFYIKSFSAADFKIDKNFRYHFYAIIIDLAPTFIVISYFIGIYAGLVTPNPKPWGIFIDQFNVYADIPRWASLTIYILLSLKYLSNRVETNAISKNSLNWLRIFLKAFLVFQVIWLLYLIPYVIPIYTDKILDIFGWYPVYVPLAILVYWLGIKGYIVGQNDEIATKKTSDIKNLPSTEELIKIIDSLRLVMEDKKTYRNPNINLNTLAAQLGYTPKIISTVVNQHFEKSFNEYINDYRIAEFKVKFLGPDFDHLTITGLALECGFNSQATFQRAFKESTGLSPSAYRKANAIKVENSSQIMI